MSDAIEKARAEFEAWISSPPYEENIDKYPNDPALHAWPKCYRNLSVQLAFDAWQAALEAEQARPAIPEDVYTAMAGVCTAACDGVVLVRYEDWNKIVGWANSLLTAAKEQDK